MYAIVDIAGQQFKVEKEQRLFVNRLEGKEDSSVNFEEVLLIDNNGKVVVGTPIISGASVSAKILKHLKADKIRVFKKKRRKGYQKLNGHRQLLTQIQIEKILEKGTKSKPTEKTADTKEEPTEVSTTDKPKTAAKKTPAKKAAPKTKAPTAKKTAAKPAKSGSAASGKTTAKKTAKKKDK